MGSNLLQNQVIPSDVPAEAVVGSPLKKQRPSMDAGTVLDSASVTQSLTAALDSAISGGSAPSPTPPVQSPHLKLEAKMEEDEEL